MERQPVQPADSPPPQVSKLSGLAVASLVLAVIPCCPPSNVLGAILGLVASRRILLSRGRLRGLGLARAAIVAGVFLSVLSAILWSRMESELQKRSTEAMTSTVEQVMDAAIGQQPAEVSQHWSTTDGPVPKEEQILAFGAELERRYGAFERVAIVSGTQSSIFSRRTELAVIFHFARAKLNGSVDLDFLMQSIPLSPSYQVRSVLVEDPEAGDLRLPVAPEGN